MRPIHHLHSPGGRLRESLQWRSQSCQFKETMSEVREGRTADVTVDDGRREASSAISGSIRSPSLPTKSALFSWPLTHFLPLYSLATMSPELFVPDYSIGRGQGSRIFYATFLFFPKDLSQQSLFVIRRHLFLTEHLPCIKQFFNTFHKLLINSGKISWKSWASSA